MRKLLFVKADNIYEKKNNIAVLDFVDDNMEKVSIAVLDFCIKVAEVICPNSVHFVPPFVTMQYFFTSPTSHC